MNYFTCKFIDVDEAKKHFDNLYIMERQNTIVTIKSAVSTLRQRRNKIDADAVGIPYRNLDGKCQLLIATEKTVYKDPKLQYVFIDKELEKYEKAKEQETAKKEEGVTATVHNSMDAAYEELTRRLHEEDWKSVSIYYTVTDGKYKLKLKK